MTLAKRSFYGFLLLVFGGGVYAAAHYLPTSEILSTIAGSASLTALVAFVVQVMRDEAAHQKAVRLQNDAQGFEIGATSHMANTVFDKHKDFCEEYIKEVQATIATLVREHATEEALTHSTNLARIRERHATWVTVGMSAQVAKFEAKLRHIGAQAHFVTVTSNHPDYAEQRSKAIDTMFEEFEEVLPELFKRKPNEEVSADKIIQAVRCMLGIEKLVEMRGLLLDRAHAFLTGKKSA